MDAPYSSSRNSFHLTRFMLAAMVILCHSYWLLGRVTPLSALTGGLLNEGQMAVDGFLVISGFLICQSAVRSRNALTFLGKRALRILPGFVCALFFSALLVGGLAFAGTYAEYVRMPEYGPFRWIWNWLTLNLQPEQTAVSGVFFQNPIADLNASLWTIRFLVFLYVLMALLVLTRLYKRRPTYIVLFSVFLILRILLVCFDVRLWDVDDSRFWLLSSQNYDRFTQTGLYFFTGTILYAYRRELPRRWYLAVIAALLLVVSCFFAFLPARASAAEDASRVLWQLACVPLRLVYMAALPSLVIYLASSPMMSSFSRIGDLSFGMYVYSFPVQQLLVHIFPGWPPLSNFLLTLVIVLPIAAWSWRCIEGPALRLKQRSAPTKT